MLFLIEKVALIASLPSSLRFPESLLAELLASPAKVLPAPLTNRISWHAPRVTSMLPLNKNLAGRFSRSIGS